MKAYKILKHYPGLNDYFQEGDIIYNFPIEGNYPLSIPSNQFFVPELANVYKKILHQQKDPFLWADNVENNPEYFMELEMIEIQSEGNTVILSTWSELK